MIIMDEKEYIENNHAHDRITKIIRVPEDEKDGGIVTPLSLSQSLSAPRAPPEGSIHRNFLLRNVNPQEPACFWNNNSTKRGKIKGQHKKAKNRFKSRASSKTMMPHPHLSPSLSFGDKLTRYLGGSVLSLSYQNYLRTCFHHF